MKIHILSTVNGQQNEGMRNVATHIARCLESEHTVMYSGLKQLFSILVHALSCDVTMVFARANKQIYWMIRVVSLLCKHVWLACVQTPDEDFVRLNSAHPLNCHYLSLLENDTKSVICKDNRRKYTFSVGIDTKKFSPINTEKQKELKRKYGFPDDKLLVVHVGHCSRGRGLEDFLALDERCYERLVVASGMFEDLQTAKTLEVAGIPIFREYNEHIEEIYQMADVYLFPTKSTEYVISVPLSVMEALSCGTPVVGYKSFANLNAVSSVEGSVVYVDSASELNETIRIQAGQKTNSSLLHEAKTWKEVTQQIVYLMETEKG